MKASVNAITAWSDVPPPYDGLFDDDVAELTEHTATVATQSLLAVGVNDIEVRAAQGPTARVLIDAADESDASMLVVGTRGLGPLSGLLLGSTSRKLLYSSHLPVVVVPQQSTIEPAPLARVLVGAEHSPVAERVLSWAAWFCSNVGVPATIAHCADSGCEQPPGHVERCDGHAHSDLEQMLEPFRDLEVQYSVALAPCDPRVALPDTAARHQAGLIVIGASGAGRFRGLGSTTSYLLRRSPVPLAVIPLSGKGPS
jgi:nucleotide-binding universal stress UspA family protein